MFDISFSFCVVIIIFRWHMDHFQFIMKRDDIAPLLTSLLGSDQNDVTGVALTFAVEWHNTRFVFSVREEVFNVCLV